MTAPFLDASTFAGMFRPLTTAESNQVTPLLQVVSDWIRGQKPGIADDDSAAILVCFQMARDEILYGKYVGSLSSFNQQTMHSIKAGVIDRDEVDKWISDSQRRILGLSLVSAPQFNFGTDRPPCDPLLAYWNE